MIRDDTASVPLRGFPAAIILYINFLISGFAGSLFTATWMVLNTGSLLILLRCTRRKRQTESARWAQVTTYCHRLRVNVGFLFVFGLFFFFSFLLLKPWPHLQSILTWLGGPAWQPPCNLAKRLVLQPGRQWKITSETPYSLMGWPHRFTVRLLSGHGNKGEEGGLSNSFYRFTTALSLHLAFISPWRCRKLF